MNDPAAARAMALKGKEDVRRKFLTPRLLRDWLVLFNRQLGNDTGGVEVEMVASVRARRRGAARLFRATSE